MHVGREKALMVVSLSSSQGPSFLPELIPNFISAGLVAEGDAAQKRPEFLRQFIIVRRQLPPTLEGNQHGLFAQITDYTYRLNRPAVVHEQAESLIYNNQPIDLSRSRRIEGDARLALGLCLAVS